MITESQISFIKDSLKIERKNTSTQFMFLQQNEMEKKIYWKEPLLTPQEAYIIIIYIIIFE